MEDHQTRCLLALFVCGGGALVLGARLCAIMPPPIAQPATSQRVQKGELLVAAAGGREFTVRQLLAHGADPNDVDSGSRAALAHAAANGHENCAAVLLEAGAEIDSENKWDETPLYKAAYGGHQACVSLLLAAGADANRSNTNGRTPLMAAAWDGHCAICSELLKAGADPGIKSQFKKRNSQQGDTALYWAQANGHDDCVAVLRAAGAV